MTDTTIVDATPPSHAPKPDYYSQLDAAETLAWAMLEAGATSSKQPFHTLVLATVGADGAPQARTVVLREADRSNRLLRANTDARSCKAHELGRDSRAQLLFYDAGAKVQVRATARAQVLTGGDVWATTWAATPPGSRVCYLAENAPGSIAPEPKSGLPPFADHGRRVAPDLLETGAAHFAVMRFDVEAIDWLYLHSHGHRRALFDYTRGTSNWVAP